jgi:polar amino acid transport system substrate-binding protein
MFKPAFVVVFLIIISKPVISQSNSLTASFGGTLAPWVQDEGKSGILVDLLKGCLTPSNYELVVELHPYERRIYEYENGNVDIVTDISSKIIEEKGLKGYFTGNLYAYENFLFALEERNVIISSIQDINGYSLLSWQGAIAKIGGEYAQMAKHNAKYSETYNQKTQLRMLFSKRVDLIQMDGNIYEFYRQELQQDSDLDVSAAVQKIPLFGKSPNGFLFKSKEARDACLSNLEQIRKDIKNTDSLQLGL